MFQPDKITRLAISVFKEEGQLSIFGQGMLKRMFLSAHLSGDKKEIYPPREHYYFNRNTHTPTDRALVRKVATYFILTQKEAETTLRQWEEWIIALARKRQVRFGEYGVFRFDGQLDFHSDSLYMYEWLPSIRYYSDDVPLQDWGPEKKLEPALVLDKVPVRKRKALFPVLWSVLGVLFAFALFLWSEPLNLLIDQNAELNKRLVNVAPESYSMQKEVEYFSDTHEVRSADSPTTDEIRRLRPSVLKKESELTDSPSIRKSHSDKLIRPDKRNESADVIAVHPTPAQPEASKRCTLIVGAFANSNNVDRMVDRLAGYGVKVVTMERRTLTLVGANIDCSDRNQITTLQQEIEPNAWIYKK